MASRLIPLLLVVLATCMAQDCPAQPNCGCAQQPTIIQMTCGNGGQSHPPPPPPPIVHPSPEPYTTTGAYEWEQPSTTEIDVGTLPSTDPVTCTKDSELAIVIDSSGSIGEQDYKIILEFSARLAEAWKQHSGNGVAAYIYSWDAEKIFTLNEGRHMDAQAVKDAILNVHYMESSTATDKGLEMAGQDLKTHGRPNIAHNLVLLTDGSSNDPALTTAAAQDLHAMGIRAVSVGIGSYLNNDELLAVAGGQQDHVFNSNQFNQLLTLLKPVSELLCEPVSEPGSK